MEIKKAVGLDDVPNRSMESIKKFRYRGLAWFFNKILIEEKTPMAWRKNCVILIYKGE